MLLRTICSTLRRKYNNCEGSTTSAFIDRVQKIQLSQAISNTRRYGSGLRTTTISSSFLIRLPTRSLLRLLSVRLLVREKTECPWLYRLSLKVLFNVRSWIITRASYTQNDAGIANFTVTLLPCVFRDLVGPPEVSSRCSTGPSALVSSRPLLLRSQSLRLMVSFNLSVLVEYFLNNVDWFVRG